MAFHYNPRVDGKAAEGGIPVEGGRVLCLEYDRTVAGWARMSVSSCSNDSIFVKKFILASIWLRNPLQNRAYIPGCCTLGSP